MWRTEEHAEPGSLVAGAPSRRRVMPWGMWLPMVTPMRAGAIDLPATSRLVEHYVRSGLDGLIILGTTGEGSLLSGDERRRVAAAVLEAAAGALPVMAGVGAVDTRDVCRQVRELDSLDLAGYLVPPPFYLRVSEAGMLWHVGEVLKATGRPLMLYNVPKRTGSSMPVRLAERLLAHPQVVAVKECDAANLRALSHKPGAAVLCGEDAAMLDHLLAAGAGAVPASAHIRPDLFVQLFRLAQTGHTMAAGALFAKLSRLIFLLFAEPNPAPVKAALALEGRIAAEVRLPLQPVSQSLMGGLEEAMSILPPMKTA